MNNYGKTESLTINQIALKQLQLILNIGSHELGSRNVTITQREDTRKSYCEAVENLSCILLPFFDEKIKPHYDECISIMKGFDSEIRKKLSKEYDLICQDTGRQNLGNDFIIMMKLKFAKKLFRELNLLLKRKDYLMTKSHDKNSSDDTIEA